MILRPTDASGDMLPVLFSTALVSGAPAAAQLVQDRLHLLAGDWWENRSWGNEILEMMQESRLTEADQQTILSYLTSYIRRTAGVTDIKDVTFFVDNGRCFHFQCTVLTEEGYTEVNYSF